MDSVISNRFSIFKDPVTDYSAERYFVYEYLPNVFSPESNYVEFQLSGSSDSFYDLYNSRIQFEAEILNEDGSPLDWTDDSNRPNITFINDLGNTIYNHGEIVMNNQSFQNSYMAYRSILKTLLETKTSYLEGAGTNSLFYQDTNDFDGSNSIAAATNIGAFKRQKIVEETSPVQLTGDVRNIFDIADQTRLIPSQTKMTIRLYLNADNFILLNGDTSKQYITRVSKFKLFMPFIQPRPALSATIEAKFQEKEAKFPYMKHDFRVFSLTTGQTSAELNNIFSGQIPSKIFVMIVRQSNLSGNVEYNPFYFHHCDVKSMSLCINGFSSCPTIMTDFSKGNFAQPMHSLVQLGAQVEDGTLITRSNYGKGYSLWVYNLDHNLSHQNLTPTVQKGDARLSLTFGTPLPGEFSVLIVGRRPCIAKVNKDRNYTIEE